MVNRLGRIRSDMKSRQIGSRAVGGRGGNEMQLTSHRGSAAVPFTESAMAVPSLTEGGDGLPGSSAEWLSAYMDGESGDDALAPDFLATPAGEANWDLYHFIGDVARSPELALPVSSAFHARLVDALAKEAPIIAAPRRLPPHRFMRRYGLPGLAAAAAVASVTWMAQPYFGGLNDADLQLAGQLAAAPAASAVVNVSTPLVARKPVAKPDLAALGEYLDAHRQIAGRSAVRRVSADSYATEAGQR